MPFAQVSLSTEMPILCYKGQAFSPRLSEAAMVVKTLSCAAYLSTAFLFETDESSFAGTVNVTYDYSPLSQMRVICEALSPNGIFDVVLVAKLGEALFQANGIQPW